jgi:aspartyl-tRNA(Asn)/glutamyl-tRNA(Gln) amidotransferase subunit A
MKWPSAPPRQSVSSVPSIIPGNMIESLAALPADRLQPSQPASVSALGTDAGGSIRVPSAYCGIVGLKSTYGLVGMRGGGEAGWWSMNHVGPMCRSVADAALLLSAIAGYDPRDSTSVEAPIPNYTAALRAKVSALRLGVPRAVFYDKLDPEIEAAINTALERLRGLTAGLREVSLQPISDMIAPNIVLAETTLSTHPTSRRHRSSITPPSDAIYSKGRK